MTHENLSGRLVGCGEKMSESDMQRELVALLRRDRRRMKWMMALSVGFWVLTSAGVIAFAQGVLVFVAPRLEMVLEGESKYGRGLVPLLPWVLFYLPMALVILLFLAALSTVTFVHLSRRTTLRQVNVNLVEITERLKLLQDTMGRR